ncbi:MAG: alpha/beta hydrolase [Flavobacteriales bacterium]|nr:alpha/beta hydrolase [Flavobacteriales bacterium]
MKKAAYSALILIIGISVAYMIGPQAPEPKLDPTPVSLSVGIDSLDNWIAHREANHTAMKPGNQAEIVWFNDSVSATEYAVVYIHGFTASKVEGEPVDKDFAARYGCNLYLPRLYGHGLDTTEPLIDLTPENYLQSAKEAVAIGKKIGRKVILMCTSTGGTLGLYLAAHDPEIDAVICYSPNIDIYDKNSQVLTKPWGLQLAKMLVGSDYREYEATDEFKKNWQTKYRIESLVALRSLVDATMTSETFKAINQPVFVGAYYKDAEHQDNVVSVDAMRLMMPQLATSNDQKRFIEFPNVGAHVMTNPLRSEDVKSVETATFQFAEEVIGLKPIE